MAKIRVWTEVMVGDRKEALPGLKRAVAVWESVEVEGRHLCEALKNFLHDFESVFSETEKRSSFTVDEIELNLAVNGEGGIELIGKLSASAQAGVKVRLKPRAA